VTALASFAGRAAAATWLAIASLIRYLRGNHSMQPDQVIQLRRGAVAADAAGPCRNEVLSKEDEALLEEFARDLPVALGLPPERVILVFGSDRKAIYAGKTRAETRKCQARPAQANDRLAELAAGNGMHVIDSYPVFQRHFRERLGPLGSIPRGRPLECRCASVNGSRSGKHHRTLDSDMHLNCTFPILC
jgi:hypothetical protein